MYTQGRRHGFEGGGVQFVFLNPAKKIFLGPPTFFKDPPTFGGVLPKSGGVLKIIVLMLHPMVYAV